MSGPLSNPYMFKSATATGFYEYQIANSIRGSAGDDRTLKFTAGTPTSTTKMTMSFWVKRHTPNSTDAGANWRGMGLNFNSAITYNDPT